MATVIGHPKSKEVQKPSPRASQNKSESRPGKSASYICKPPKKLPNGFEPPSLDSESRVLTVTPWELAQEDLQ